MSRTLHPEGLRPSPRQPHRSSQDNPLDTYRVLKSYEARTPRVSRLEALGVLTETNTEGRRGIRISSV